MSYVINSTEGLDQELERIRIITGRSDRSEVLMDAIEVYSLIIEHIKNGAHLYIDKREVKLPYLEKAAGREQRLTIVE